MNEETTYWFLSALAQCIATLLGFVIVGLFYYLENIDRAKENIKFNHDAQDKFKELDIYISKIFDVCLKREIAETYGFFNIMLLSIYLTITLLALLIYRDFIFVFGLLIVFVSTLGKVIYNTYQIVVDYKDWIQYTHKQKFFKKVQKKLHNTIYLMIGMEILKIIFEKDTKRKFDEFIEKKMEEKYQMTYR